MKIHKRVFMRNINISNLLFIITFLAVGGLYAAIPTFNSNGVDAALDGAYYSVAADLDGDGDIDVISAGEDADVIVWYENDGSQSFADPDTIQSTFDGAVCVQVADLDKDGDMDVIGAANVADDLVWWENDGSENFAQRDVDTNYNGAFFVTVFDVSLDGNPDLVSVGWDEGAITVWESLGDPDADGWDEVTVASGLSEPSQALPFDMDHDGDIDIVAALHGDDEFIYYENDGAGGWNVWTIDDAMDGASSIGVADLDHDGDLDVVGAVENDGTVYWWANDGTPANDNWTQYTIDASLGGAYWIVVKDLNVDAFVDIVTTSHTGDRVSWYLNDGTPDVGSWTKRDIASGLPGARAATISDVDLDGYQDVITSAADNDDVIWWENELAVPITPTFVSDTLSLSYDGAQDVKIVDLDRDGDADFISVGYGGDDLSWWENDGDQNFAQRVISSTINTPNSVDYADIDGDGDIDIVTTTYISDEVSWWENDGTPSDGGWTENNVSSAINGASSAQPVDLDQDGDIDIIAAAYADDDIIFFENDGSESFTTWTVAGAYNGARHVHCADVDSDGDIDIVAAGALEDDVTWFINDGSPDNDNWTEVTIDGALNEANAVHAIDIDSDGDIDVVATSGVDDNVIWYENDGTPTGANWSSSVVDGTWGGGSDVLAMDFDGDGDIDIAASAYDDDEFSWWENNGSQSFTGHSISTNINGVQAFAAGDIDFDGDIDYVTCASAGDELLWWENQQTGEQTTTWSSTDLSTNFTGATAVYASDFDGDGLPDVVATSRTKNDLLWWSNDGDGTYTQNTINLNLAGASWCHAEDVDGDGDYDVIATAMTDDDVVWYANNGSGSFSLNTIDANFNGAYSVFATDVTGDGNCDIVACAVLADSVVLYENNGSESFTKITVIAAFDSVSCVFAKDVDGDGDMDILATAIAADDITWFENDGSENFTTRTIKGDFDGACSVYALDMDLDGDVDVLGAAKAADDITWWENDGTPADGGWTEHTVDGDFDGARSVYAADVDRDGDIDIVGVASIADEVAWWENDGSQSFTKNVIATGINGARCIRGSDVDLDGDLDLLTTAYDAGEVTIWENEKDPIASPYLSTKAIDRYKWTMIGIPVEVADGTPDELFSDNFNNSSPATGEEYWTLSRWDAVNEWYVRYGEDGPDEPVDTDPPDMAPGLGYWIIQDTVDNCVLDITAAQTVGVVDQSTRYPVALVAPSTAGGYRGLIQAANPYRYSYDWRQTWIFDATLGKRLSIFNAADSGWISGYAYTWDPATSQYVNINFDPDSTNNYLITPWSGFWIEQLEEGRSLQVEFTSYSMFSSLASLKAEIEPKSTSDGIVDWVQSLTLITADSSFIDENNRFGSLSRAKDEYDMLDAIEFTPQSTDGFVQMFFPHPDWAMQADRFSYDYRVMDIEDSSEVWDFTVRQWKKSNTEVVLKWFGIDDVAPEVSLKLLDAESGEVLAEMQREGEYRFTTGDTGFEDFPFKIEAVWYPSSVADGKPEVPVEFGLISLYPNPFNDAIKISYGLTVARAIELRVFDLQGRLIDTIETQTLKPGVHVTSWTTGGIPSGTYLFELKSGDDISRQKAVLMK
ncbi:FG-GAP-like repeat-containing protein [Calditrichota bacterium]